MSLLSCRRVAFNIGPLYDETGSLQIRSGIHYSVDAWLAALLRHNNDNDWQVRPFAPLGVSQMLHTQGKNGGFAWWPEGSAEMPLLDTGGNRNPAPKNPTGFRVWRRVGLIQTQRAAQKYDLMHVLTSSYLPLQKFAPKTTLATIWDMTVLTHADTHTPENRIAWESYFDWAKNATGIVTISQAAKAEIVTHLGVAADRVFVVPLAARANVAPVAGGPERNALLQSVGVRPEVPFVLYGGTLEPRKNLVRLIAAFAQVANEMPKNAPLNLVLAGGTWAAHDQTLKQIARDLGMENRVFFPGYVSGNLMNALMSACAVFAFPSLAEGFGMPPLEAMTCGAPVVVSNTTSLPEVVGEAGILINPEDTNDLARALHTLLTNTNENAARREASIKRAKLFSWDETARQTRLIYDIVGNANS